MFFYKLIRRLLPNWFKVYYRSIFFWIFNNFPFHLYSQNFKSIIPSGLNNSKLILGHSSYLESLGGTERYILSKVELLSLNGKNFVYIYPEYDIGSNRFLLFFQKIKFGIIVNNYKIATVNIFELNRFLRKTLSFESLSVQHTKGWPLRFLLSFIKSQCVEKEIFLHDFQTRCPTVNQRCLNGEKFCQKVYLKSYINFWKKTNSKLLRLFDHIYCPSDFLSMHYSQYGAVVYDMFQDILKVESKENLAFVGYESDLKGISLWNSIVKNAQIRKKYNLFHFGKCIKKQSGVTYVEYDYTYESNKYVTQLLRDNKIKYALLWSVVPESFSFTMKECFESSVHILTNIKSGNVAFEVSKDLKLGKVFESEYDLCQYLLKSNI